MFGLLNVNKPPGKTSRDVVNAVQRLARQEAGKVKVGHAGTLDPLAIGVLIVCLGPATRLAKYVQRMAKSYEGTFLLGRESDTEDIEGEVQELENPPIPTREDISAALPEFIGRIMQRPPAYSALKVKGKRAYDLARRGDEVKLEPRPVQIDRLEILSYDYPQLTLGITCGAGTYIRSLGRAIAEHLATAAVMSALVRTAIGDFRAADAVTLEKLESDGIAGRLLLPELAVAELPCVVLSEEGMRAVRHGRSVGSMDVGPASGKEAAAFDAGSRLVAIMQRHEPGQWRPAINFAAC